MKMRSLVNSGTPMRWTHLHKPASARIAYLLAIFCLITTFIQLCRSGTQNIREIRGTPQQLTENISHRGENNSLLSQIDKDDVPLQSTAEYSIETFTESEEIEQISFTSDGGRNNTQLKRKLLHFDPKILHEIVRHGEQLSKSKKTFIYVLLFNYAYRHLVANWLCNTATFETVHERLLLVSLSNDTCDEVLGKEGKATCIETAIRGYDDPADYATDTFDAIMLFRAHLATTFARRSVKVVMVEADATWFRDPLPLFVHEFSNKAVGTVTPRNGGISMGAIRAMSPMVIRPTIRTRTFLRALARRLSRSSAQNDQAVYNVLCAARYQEHRCGMFYYEDIADGIWFDKNVQIRSMIRPYIVNNNYIIGKHSKEERLKKFGLWFLDGNGSCNSSAVANALTTQDTAVDIDSLF